MRAERKAPADTLTDDSFASRERWLEGDPALLEGYRRGDREAMATVFRTYLPIVMRALRGGARVEGLGRMPVDLDPFELEALAQETFLRVFSERTRTSYDGTRPFSAYIATIAKNLLVDRARQRGRERRRSLEGVGAHGGVDLVEAPEQQVAFEAGEIREHLAAFKAGLDDEDRVVFVARFEEQLSLREAAAATGLSLFILRRRDVRLRLALLGHLRGAGYLENVDVRVGVAVLERRKDRP